CARLEDVDEVLRDAADDEPGGHLGRDSGHAPGRRCPGDGGRFGVDPGPNDLRLTPDPVESGGDGRDVAAAQDETFELDRIRDLFEHQGVGEPATGYGSADEDLG